MNPTKQPLARAEEQSKNEQAYRAFLAQFPPPRPGYVPVYLPVETIIRIGKRATGAAIYAGFFLMALVLKEARGLAILKADDEWGDERIDPEECLTEHGSIPGARKRLLQLGLIYATKYKMVDKIRWSYRINPDRFWPLYVQEKARLEKWALEEGAK